MTDKKLELWRELISVVSESGEMAIKNRPELVNHLDNAVELLKMVVSTLDDVTCKDCGLVHLPDATDKHFD